MQATKGRDDSRQFIEDLLATGSEIHALELMMRRAGIALEPPKGWTKETAVYPGLER